MKVQETILGLKEISKSSIQTSLPARKSVQLSAETTGGIQEIALSSTQMAVEAKKVDKHIQFVIEELT